MTTTARATRVGEIADVLRAAQLLVSDREPGAEREVLGLLCVLTGASSVTLRRTGSNEATLVRGTPFVSGPPVVQLRMRLQCGGEELGHLTVSAPTSLTVGQEQGAALIGDLLALHLSGLRLAAELTEGLAAARAEQRRIAGRFIEGAERERSELAGQLHDGPLQSLVAARYVTDMAGLAVRDGSFDAAREGVQSGLVDARRALWQLRPHAADGNDLPGALRSLGQQLGEYIGLQVEVVADNVPPALPPAVSSAAFRLAQEMLCAGVRDRAATSATVEVEVDKQTLVVVVTDDGVGQVVEVPAGLARWREWVSLLGGDVRLRGKRGGGAWMKARLPLSDYASDRTVTQ